MYYTQATWFRPGTVFEKHRELSNKLLLFENLMAYCENKNKDLQVGEDTILGFYRKYYPE